jgi:hypothetical protein
MSILNFLRKKDKIEMDIGNVYFQFNKEKKVKYKRILAIPIFNFLKKKM